MSRFLFAIWPLSGHVNPQIVLADALRARGHEVAFYTGAVLEALLASEGFCIFPFQHVSEERVEQIVVTLETQAPVGLLTPLRTARALQDWLIDTVPDQVADLESVLATWQPDVVVTETAMWGPSLVLWERTGVPVAISSTLMGCLIPGTGRAAARAWAAAAAHQGRASRRARHRPCHRRSGDRFSPAGRSCPGAVRPAANGNVGERVHGAAAPLSRPERAVARLQPTGLAAQRPLHRAVGVE